MTVINSIKVYSRATCAPCKTVKAYLENKRKRYSEIDIDQDPTAFQEATKLSGVFTTPQTVVTKTVDGVVMQDVIVGFNPTRLSTI